VGWHWAQEIGRVDHQVWVLTRRNNQTAIEAALKQHPEPNLEFIYYDLPRWAKWWKRGGRGIRLYYVLWQWGAYRTAKALSRKVRFEQVHHITFGGIHLPSFMGFLGVPFVFGPVGGGERTPLALRRSFPLRGYVLELIRDVANQMLKINPISRSIFRRASLILCKTSETAGCVPAKYRDKSRVQLEIGITATYNEASNPSAGPEHDPLRVLYVGRLIYWKGLHLALRAFAEARKNIPHMRMTVIGSGPDESWLHSLAQNLQIESAVEWIPWVSQPEVLKKYSHHDVLLFPTLHDSSGNVVLEALSRRVPVICLDLGGPGVIVDNTCGRVVSTAGKTEADVVAGLTAALHDLASNRERQACRAGAQLRAEEYSWDRVVRTCYGWQEPPASRERFAYS
jgi:glycosyltransferase involved in cell wall biosynthesis